MSAFIEGFLEGGAVTRQIINTSLFILFNAYANELASAGEFVNLVVILMALVIMLSTVRSYAAVLDTEKSRSRMRGVLGLARGALQLASMSVGFIIMRITAIWITRQGIVDGVWRFVAAVMLVLIIAWVLVVLSVFSRYREVNQNDMHWRVYRRKKHTNRRHRKRTRKSRNSFDE
jgi:hypothetical protein